MTINDILNTLPREPRSYDINDDPGFWTNGDMILCPSEYEAEIIADFLETMFKKTGNDILTTTGYFDPFEDYNSGEQDECTGFYYVDFE